MNNIYLSGNLVSDPNVRLVGDKMKVANVALAVKDAGKKNTTSFIELTAWNKTADLLMQYFVKGQSLAVAGVVKQEKWVDKKTEKEVSKVVVIVNEILNLPSKFQSETKDNTDEGGEYPF